MDSWFKSVFGGIVLAALVVGAIALFNYGEAYLLPYVEQYTGMADSNLLVVLLLAFLVGFALTSKHEVDERQDLFRSTSKAFAGPTSRVKTSYESSEVEEIELVQDAYISYVQDRVAKLDDEQPIVLKIKLHPPSKMDFYMRGRTMPLQRDVILYYLETLKKFPNFKYVMFVDWFNRFLFFTKASAFRDEIEPIEGTHIIDLLNANRVQELSELSMFNPHALTNHASNMKALRFMARHEISEAMVVSHSWGRRAIGIVELNKLLSTLLAEKKFGKRKPRPKKKPSAQPIYDDDRQDSILAEDEDVKPAGPPPLVTDDKRQEPILSNGSDTDGGTVFDDVSDVSDTRH